MSRARLDGMAKPMPWTWAPPCEPAAVSVGMPITSPGGRHQRAAAVARVDRRAGLDRVRQGGARLAVAGGLGDDPARRGDDPARHAAGQAKRVADREDHVTCLRLGRVTELRRLQPGRVVDPDHGQVVGRVAADEARGARRGVAGNLDLELGRVPRDVGVRDDVPRVSSTTPDPSPSPVLISTTDGSTWRTTSA